jgi:hypothetical protein
VGCGGFDFNCDTTEDQQDLTDHACIPDGSNCLHCGTLTGWRGDPPGCGEESSYATSYSEQQVSCSSACGVVCDSCTNPVSENRTLACR